MQLALLDRRRIITREGWRGQISMNEGEALIFIKKHGVVLMSARGPVPNSAEAMACEPIRGSWWGHPKSRQMY